MTVLDLLSVTPTADRRTSTPVLTAPTRGWAFLGRQLACLTAAVAVYFSVRSLTAGDAATATAHAHDLIGFERALGIFVERDLQRAALDLDGVSHVVNAIYIYGHWPVIAAVLGWLAWRRPAAYLVYRDALIVSGLVGMLIVAVFPVAPPRLMDLGFLDTVTSGTHAYRVLQPPAFTKPFAAMPSFHVGWDLLVGLALVRESGNVWLRAAGRALPVLMVASVVVTGNHYFLDAVAGDAIVLASLALVSWWRARSSVRRTSSRSSGGQPGGGPVPLAVGRAGEIGGRSGGAAEGQSRAPFSAKRRVPAGRPSQPSISGVGSAERLRRRIPCLRDQDSIGFATRPDLEERH